MDPAVRFLHEEPGIVFAVWRNVFLGVWGVSGNVALARRLGELSLLLEKENPRGFSSLHFIATTASLPDGPAREEFQHVVTRFAKSLACFGTVIDGQGFWASAIRSFFTGLVFISRSPYKTHHAASVSELARWLPAPHAERTGVQLSPEDLERALEEVRLGSSDGTPQKPGRAKPLAEREPGELDPRPLRRK